MWRTFRRCIIFKWQLQISSSKFDKIILSTRSRFQQRKPLKDKYQRASKKLKTPRISHPSISNWSTSWRKWKNSGKSKILWFITKSAKDQNLNTISTKDSTNSRSLRAESKTSKTRISSTSSSISWRKTFKKFQRRTNNMMTNPNKSHSK